MHNNIDEFRITGRKGFFEGEMESYGLLFD
jgi:hypothetical protein